MSSFQDLNIPVISFIARPFDSRKGLQIYLDAISCLASIPGVPVFSCWVIGGNFEEVDYIHSMIQWRPPLRDLFALGRILVWGRVSYESLAEFYPRSTVVVMPSSREQFGLTAIETMMCGRPVIATDVGGLKDAIVDDSTGTLMDTYDSALLANVLVGYLRNPERCEYLGQIAAAWARFGFSQEKSYASFLALYQKSLPPSDSAFCSYSALRQQKIEELSVFVRQSFRKRVQVVSDLSCSGHFSFCIRIDDNMYFAKGYAPDPSTDSSVFTLPVILRPERTFDEYASRCHFHEDNPAAPRAVAYFPDAWLIIFEWGDPLRASGIQSTIREIAEAYRSYRPLSSDSELLSEYFCRLQSFSTEQTADTMLQFDLVCARLNAQALGLSCLRFYQTHPQVELHRYQHGLTCGQWVVTESFMLRASAIISHLLSIYPTLIIGPAGCNGSLKPEHLLEGRKGPFACDIDSCRYTVGPYDEAHHVYKRVIREGIGPAAALATLRDLVGEQKELYLGACWLVSDLLYEALAGLARGKNEGVYKFMRFSHEFHAAAWKLIGNDETHNSTDSLAVLPEQVGEIT